MAPSQASARHGRPDREPDQPSSGERPRRWLGAVLLAGVALLGVGGYTLYVDARTISQTAALRQAQQDRALFSAARSAIAQEYLSLRQYRLEPAPPVRQRYTDATDAVITALEEAEESPESGAQADARRLGALQSAFRALADRLIQLTTDDPAGADAFERSELDPAYQTLLREADSVTDSRAATAARRAEALERTHTLVFVDTALALAIGLVLAVWGLLVSDRRAPPDERDTGDAADDGLQDTLTGFPNRACFDAHLRDALAEAKASEGRGLTILMIGLGGVPTIVRAHGAQSLDQLLVAASRRLRRVIRDDDEVARTGEQDFGVVLHEITDLEAVEAVTDRIEQALGRLFRLQSGVAAVRANIGIAVCPPDADPDEAVRRAESAMRRAAAAGGGTALAANTDDGVKARRPLDVSAELRVLLQDNDRDGQLELEYHPVVRSADVTAAGTKARVLWRHPVHGQLPASRFVPAAEHDGLATHLFGHLLARLAAQGRTWQDAGYPLTVALEVPAACLTDPWFPHAVAAAVRYARLDPAQLRVEVAEAGVLAEPQLAAATLDAVRQHGVMVAVTGFGTAPSSPAQLREVPADELAIDYGALSALGAPGTAAGHDLLLVQHAVQTAHALGLSAAAEGVPDAATYALLHRAGFDALQGPVFGGGVPAEEVPAACELARRLAFEALTSPAAQPAT